MEKIINDFYNSGYYKIEPTILCKIMDECGSDKGTLNKGKGNYTKIYDFLFKEIKNNVSNIFEVGLGTNNIDTPSNMGTDGIPGASLRGWREYFNNANVYGADIDRRILFQENRINTFFVDQFDESSINNLWDNFSDIEFDIIIDDGIHDISHVDNSGNLIFFKNSIHKLKKSGYYVIEDVACDTDGDYVSPLAISFIDKVKSGLYGDFSYVDILKIPAFRDGGGFRNTQIILIKK